MRLSLLLGVCALGTFFASAACSSKDAPPPGGAGGDSGTSGGSGGASASGASSGATANGGSGGSGSTSTSDGGSVTGGGSGGTETGTGGVPPSCTPDAGVDGGASWRDFEEGTCKACPATALTECEQFTAAPGPSFDTTTKVLTLHVQPGLTEILGLRLEGRANVQGSTEYTFVAVGGAVSENVLTFDFSSKLPPGALGFYEGLIVGDDACGDGVDTSASKKFEIRFDAAGAVDRLGCVD
jgi:hypothetical protein